MSKEIEPHILKLYKVDKYQGNGAYGHVWRVEDKLTGERLALKKIFDAFQNSTDAQRTYRQITVLDQLRHQNIIRIKRVIRSFNNKDLYLVFEYMETDLHEVIERSILEFVHKKFIAYQIFKALKYFHSAALIHRDLKPSNVLINSSCDIKICDFGLVRSLVKYEDEIVVLSEQVATRWYRSPQVLLGCQTYGKPADMWSVGCILAQMFTKQPLFAGKSTLDQLQKITSWTGSPSQSDINSFQTIDLNSLLNQITIDTGYKNKIFQSIPQQFRYLIQSLLHFSPQKRLTVEECLTLPLFEGIHDPQNEPICHRRIILPINDNIKLQLKNYRDIIYSDIDKRYPQNSKIHQIRKIQSPKNKSSIDVKKSKQNSIYKKPLIKGNSPSLHKKPSVKVLSPAKSIKNLMSTIKAISKPNVIEKKKPVKIEKTSTVNILRNKSKQSLFSRKQSHKYINTLLNKTKQDPKQKSIVLKKSRSKLKKQQFTSSTTEEKQKHLSPKYFL